MSRHQLVMTMTGLATAAVVCAAAAGCVATGPENPSFDLSVSEAQAELSAMAEDPVELERPVLVLAGLFDPGFASRHLARALRAATGDDRIIPVSFLFLPTFDACRQHAIDMAREHFGDGGELPEVDVVGVSMGGIVARYAAMPGEDGERLPVARLFTLGTPHQGASMAVLPAFTSKQRDMRADSQFLRELNEALEEADYGLYPYVRLGDRMVGTANAAPEGQHSYWVPHRYGRFAHMLVFRDARIKADIARRLRGEEPYSGEPEPLPERWRRKGSS